MFYCLLSVFRPIQVQSLGAFQSLMQMMSILQARKEPVVCFQAHTTCVYALIPNIMMQMQCHYIVQLHSLQSLQATAVLALAQCPLLCLL